MFGQLLFFYDCLSPVTSPKNHEINGPSFQPLAHKNGPLAKHTTSINVAMPLQVGQIHASMTPILRKDDILVEAHMSVPAKGPFGGTQILVFSFVVFSLRVSVPPLALLRSRFELFSKRPV